MAQKTTYICDFCKKQIGLKVHLSIVLQGGGHCGVAIPPGKTPGARTVSKQDILSDIMYAPLGWSVKRIPGNHFLHFCHGEHMGKFFDKVIKDMGF